MGLVALEELVNLNITGSNTRPGAVPSYDFLLGIDSLVHIEHVLQIVVIKKPYFGISRLLLERHCEAVADVESSLV
jgi:hypothetical protein